MSGYVITIIYSAEKLTDKNLFFQCGTGLGIYLK